MGHAADENHWVSTTFPFWKLVGNHWSFLIIFEGFGRTEISNPTYIGSTSQQTPLRFGDDTQDCGPPKKQKNKSVDFWRFFSRTS